MLHAKDVDAVRDLCVCFSSALFRPESVPVPGPAFDRPIGMLGIPGAQGPSLGGPGVIGRPNPGMGPPQINMAPMAPISLSPYVPQLAAGRGVDSPAPFGTTFPGPGLYSMWDNADDGYSPMDSVDDILASPNLSDYGLEAGGMSTSPRNKPGIKGRGQRRPSNRDEFDGPHQFLQRPPADYIALQERELPHLPTNLLVQEQDAVLSKVNDRLSRCAYDFVAKYQFPIPLTQEMRPVERPQDREWTEWVYLLKRLATKRRIPARVLYNGQIKQLVTILENSLEMRHASKHQSRPLKDDRNILQLISAGIQVAKILRDASAMEYLDQLYVQTEERIRERTSHPFRGV